MKLSIKTSFLVVVLMLILIAQSFLYPLKIKAATAPELATAFEATDASSSSYIGNSAASSVMNSFSNIVPRKGNSLAILSTGNATIDDDGSTDFPPPGAVGDNPTLSLSFTVPDGMNSLLFDFYFLSQEYPEFVESEYNDDFTAIINGSSKVANGANFAKDANDHVIDINSVAFAITGHHSDLLGTSFDDHGGTGWVIAGAPVAPGDNITLDFVIEDVGDGVVTSTVLLDSFRFDQGSVEAGVQSRLFFSQSNLDITNCGQGTLNLYSSTVTRQSLIVDIANSDSNVLAISSNQVGILEYTSQISPVLLLQALKNGSVTLTASTTGINSGTVTVNVSGCSGILPVTGAKQQNILAKIASAFYNLLKTIF